MFLQTLLQLNILILATPALAGWTLLPAHPGAAHAACIVWQGRAVEAAPPKAEQTAKVQARRTALPQLPILPRFVRAETARPADQTPAFFAAPAASLPAFSPFPHAARAP